MSCGKSITIPKGQNSWDNRAALTVGTDPARNTRPALIVGAWALQQLWLFWVAPIIGAAIAGIVYRCFESED